jgi:hypothetical protein
LVEITDEKRKEEKRQSDKRYVSTVKGLTTAPSVKTLTAGIPAILL